MLIYTNTKQGFCQDVINGIIADKIVDRFREIGFNHNNPKEFLAWDNSLTYMNMVLNDDAIAHDINVAIEYQIPQTSKRVDFLITGIDENESKHIIIIELKQWEKAERTSKEDLVTTYIGKNIRPVPHPSYQAYSYAKTIENFNEAFQQENIFMHPCAYLHNYREEYRNEIDNPFYQEIIETSPLFLKKDALKLREFIKRFVEKSDKGELLYKIEHGRIRPSKMLQDALVSMIKGNEEFVMLDEQKVVFSTIKSTVETAISKKEKYTIIIQGGPGTGKTVVAINLLTSLKHLNVNYITKNAAPRNVYFHKLKRGNYKLGFIKTLFKSSGSFVNAEKNTFDCLLIDEAHRLNEKSGLFYKGENQIKELINAAYVSVFFIDEDQIVTTKDIGSVNEIKKWAKRLGSRVLEGDEYLLASQFRCNGSKGYIAFLDHILGIRETANYDGFDYQYDFRIFDCPNEMKQALRLKNNINNKSRMLAGYCYNWITKNNFNDDIYDIELINGFQAKWNYNNTNTWAIDEGTFDQVGCIHTSQGLEFDYVGVIIGKDLRYEKGKVITDRTKRAKTDQSLRGLGNNEKLADKIIRNTYKTLLSRGLKGCFVYCEDKELSQLLKSKFLKV
ncbi:MAG: DUF2075 domain-containing protein [Bacilli bacterium]|nr:DUF2075 domain-containing protein [Bacilli bacterium]MDD4077780.1 DUF2075 domain-containing protein [Bacilli bacterium]MDD4388611.1 DUF2075 domain-containing protein [Bacilli bacterium]